MIPRIVVPALTFLLTLTGCATQRSKLSYQEAVRRVESTLTPLVDKGIMPVNRETGPSRTVFRFNEGSRFRKLDHVHGITVSVTITSRSDGQDMDAAVMARKYGLKLSRVDDKATYHWQKVVTGALQQP